MQRIPSAHTLQRQADETHAFMLNETNEAGSYNVRLTVHGRNPVTKKTFTRVEGFSVLVT